MSKPILFVAPRDYPGVTAHMKHYEATGLGEYSDELSRNTVEGRKVVVLGAWHPIYYEAIKKLRKENLQIWLYWTSSVGQIDFSNGGIEISYIYLISDLVKSGMIDKVLCGNEQLKIMFENIIGEDKTIMMEHGFDWDTIREHYDPTIFEGENWIDLYFPSSVRKNVLPQVLGSKLANAHIHFSGIHPKYTNFADLIGANYTIMGWMDRDVFYRSIQTMQLGSQVTFAESFDYVVAEHFALARPCLFSPVIGQWINDDYLKSKLMVPDCDNPKMIGEYMKDILSMDYDDKQALNELCEKFMKRESKRRNENARRIFNDNI